MVSRAQLGSVFYFLGVLLVVLVGLSTLSAFVINPRLPSQGFILMIPAFAKGSFRGFTNPLLALTAVVFLVLLVGGGLYLNPPVRVRLIARTLLPVLGGVALALVNLVLFYY